MLSLGYAAPEQETDPGMADERSDVYSLGGILYFCLTGENPRFFRDSRIPDYLRPMLLKALEQDPRQRWPSARDFAEVLAQSAGDFLSPPHRPRHVALQVVQCPEPRGQSLLFALQLGRHGTVPRVRRRNPGGRPLLRSMLDGHQDP
jgi:serine/threonine protein kinase